MFILTTYHETWKEICETLQEQLNIRRSCPTCMTSTVINDIFNIYILHVATSDDLEFQDYDTTVWFLLSFASFKKHSHDTA